MSAPTLLMGSAVFTRHDAHTRHLLDGFRRRLAAASDRELLAAAFRVETLPGGGMADELRDLVEHETEYRRVSLPGFADWWTDTASGVTR